MTKAIGIPTISQEPKVEEERIQVLYCHIAVI